MPMKIQPIFLSEIDEQHLLSAFRKKYPDVILIDDYIWDSVTSNLRQSFDDCHAKYVFLWSPAVCEKLPYL